MSVYKLKDIKPNPFRYMDRYPVREDKIAALRESIRTTEFWNNIVARKCEVGAEIAYGHHRIEALRREYSEDHEIDLIIRELDDTTMLQIMARENAEEWGADANVEQETVRAVILAFADGRIALPSPPEHALELGQVRVAPSFQTGTWSPGTTLAYTVQTVADFLGWNHTKTQGAISALAAIERDEVPAETYLDLGPKQAAAVTREAVRAKRRAAAQGSDPEAAKAKATETAQALSQKFKDGTATVQTARSVTDSVVPPDPKPLPQMDDFARKLASDINQVLNRDGMAERMNALLPYADGLNPLAKRELASCLRQLADRADGYRNKLADSKAADGGLVEITSGGSSNA